MYETANTYKVKYIFQNIAFASREQFTLECEVRNQFNRFIISISRLDVYVQTGYFCLSLSFISEKSDIFGSSEIFSVVVLKGEIKYPLSFALRKEVR